MLNMLDPPLDAARPLADKKVLFNFASVADQASNMPLRLSLSGISSTWALSNASAANCRGVNKR